MVPHRLRLMAAPPPLERAEKILGVPLHRTEITLESGEPYDEGASYALSQHFYGKDRIEGCHQEHDALPCCLRPATTGFPERCCCPLLSPGQPALHRGKLQRERQLRDAGSLPQQERHHLLGGTCILFTGTWGI